MDEAVMNSIRWLPYCLSFYRNSFVLLLLSVSELFTTNTAKLGLRYL